MNEIVIPQKTASSLQLYDPQKGLLSIAAAETAQKHFARARNLDGLNKAIEEKLKAQRDFGCGGIISARRAAAGHHKGVAALRHLCRLQGEMGCLTGALFIAGGRLRTKASSPKGKGERCLQRPQANHRRRESESLTSRRKGSGRSRQGREDGSVIRISRAWAYGSKRLRNSP